MTPNPADEALQNGTCEAVPGSAQLMLRTPEAVLHFPQGGGRNTLTVTLPSRQSELGAQHPA
eukprot:7355138-Alexandrium_andersonii.AAC.1